MNEVLLSDYGFIRLYFKNSNIYCMYNMNLWFI